MNKVSKLAEARSKFTLDDIRDMEIILELYKRGIDITKYAIEANIWAVRVACTLIPRSVDLTSVKTFLAEWYYDYTIPECYFEEDTKCNLCGHKHCRVLFPIRNRVNKTLIFVGSRCVTYFCLTCNLLDDIYDLDVVYDNLVNAEALAREEARLENIRKSILENMEAGEFRESMVSCHTTGSKFKGKVTPLQAAILVKYLDDDCALKISLGSKTHKKDAVGVIDLISKHLTKSQLAKFEK